MPVREPEIVSSTMVISHCLWRTRLPASSNSSGGPKKTVNISSNSARSSSVVCTVQSNWKRPSLTYPLLTSHQPVHTLFCST